MATELWAIIIVLIAAVIGAFGPIFLKKATKTLKLELKALILNYNLLLGILMYAIGTIMFIPALKAGDLSVLYPMVATTYVWVSLFSMKFLKEKMNLLKWIGIFAIIIGVAFIGIGS